MKKFLVLFLIFGMFTMMVPSAKASTIDDLYAQIKTLQKQVATLQSQLTGLALRTVVPGGSLSPAPSVVAPTTLVAPTSISAPAPVPASALPAIPALPVTKIVTPTPVVDNAFPAATVPTKAVVSPVTTKDPLPVVTNTNTTTLAPIADVVNKMTIGSKGNDVLVLQKILIKKGFLKADSATGSYGTATAAAVSSFQKANKLGVDGIAGKGTISMLNKLTAADVFFTYSDCHQTLYDINGNSTVVTTPKIKVISPNGGEVYQPGQQVTLTWASCGIPANSQIQVGMNWPGSWSLGFNLTAVNTTNTGSFTYTLPAASNFYSPGGFQYGQYFKLGVTAPYIQTNGISPSDASDNWFTIGTQATSITVTSPNGGQTYIPGQQITATWSTQGIPSNSQICVSLNNYTTAPNMGGSSGLATSLVNDGTETFNLPTISSWPYMDFGNKFKVYAYPCNNPNIMDESDNMFTINTPNIPNVPFYITQWGTYGTGNGQFNTPADTAVDSSGNIYVVDYFNSRVQKFTSSGVYITQWGTFGSGDGQFASPDSIAIDSLGNVYVADMANCRIQKFTSNGTYVSQFGTYGTGNGQFYYITGIAIDSSNNIYAIDYNNYRIQKFDSSGNYILQWGTQGTGNGQFNAAYGITVDMNGDVYVVEMNNHRVQKFDSSGNYILQWGTQGTGNGQFSYPGGIASDTSNNIYVSDYNNHRIQKFTSNGNYLTQWGTQGTANGQLTYPKGLSVDLYWNVYLADSGNHRIQKFGYNFGNK